MNEWDRLHLQAQQYKAEYPPGTRIMLLDMGNDPRPVEPNMKGTVIAVDDIGTIHCSFDNGRRLGIVPDEDDFRLLTTEEIAAENKKESAKQLKNAEKVLLCIDESEGSFEGYVPGSKWNGWECPLFTKEIADRICAAFSDDETIVVSYDEKSDSFITAYPYEGVSDEFTGKDYEIDGEIKHLYPLGSGEWCWSRALEQQHEQTIEM